MKNKIRNSLRRPLAVGDRVIASDYAPEDMRGRNGPILPEAICFTDELIYCLVPFDHLEKPCEAHEDLLGRDVTAKP
jgi:hypothetical protein